MHPEFIKAELRANGIRASDVARLLGISPVTVHSVIYGKCKSRRIAKVIANVIKKTETELWPEIYEDKYKRDINNLLAFRLKIDKSLIQK